MPETQIANKHASAFPVIESTRAARTSAAEKRLWTESDRTSADTRPGAELGAMEGRLCPATRKARPRHHEAGRAEKQRRLKEAPRGER